MTHFRPCVDLHAGSVKQIVGGTLSTNNADLKTNFTSEHPSAYFAELYRKHDLRGGHVIMLGPGNEGAAREALKAWPGGLQVGGGIKDSNAKEWIDAGAERVRTSHHSLRGQEADMFGAVGYYHFIPLSFRLVFLGETAICSRRSGWRQGEARY